MKNYLYFEIETNSSDVQIKVEPVFGTIDTSSSGIPLSDDDYIPTKGDKLYFLPGVNIPRVKLKDLTMEYGIKSVRYIEDATHIFACRSTVHKISDHSWYYSMPTELFKQVFESVKEYVDEYYSENVESALEFYKEDVIFISYSSSSEIRNSKLFYGARQIPEVVSSLQYSNSFYKVNDSYKAYFPHVLNIKVYNESKLLKHINGQDAVIIDGAMFEQLSDMFESSDNDNHILAMEIMANSNYLESLLYIEMLFKEHYYQMSNCHTKNHVNFKSLLGYLGKNKNYMSTSIDEIVMSLINKGVLDTDKLNILMANYSDEIYDSGSTTYFKVKTITINEEALKIVNTNYSYQHLEDFVPEGASEATLFQEHEIIDEDIETALLRIERNELKSELIELEESTGVPEEELNINQTEEKNDTSDFEWF